MSSLRENILSTLIGEIGARQRILLNLISTSSLRRLRTLTLGKLTTDSVEKSGKRSVLLGHMSGVLRNGENLVLRNT
jgi:hypothetical protein